jgi:hypothetical protein
LARGYGDATGIVAEVEVGAALITLNIVVEVRANEHV